MPTWKQLTPTTPMPPNQVAYWVNLDNACFISPGVDTGSHIEFASVDPVDVRETPDQIVTATGNWRQFHLGTSQIFVNVANITTFGIDRSVRGGQAFTVISFALAPSHLDASGEAQQPRLVSCTVNENPAQSTTRRARKGKSRSRR